ncbi:Superfamily II DNA and RNA helicase [Allochromatium warmingii]|uniref:Superfamily II DNA and RNA helicase n=1 Tax=Allochromatium warmingii TaxID=61595 RepID=A0A1H3GV47_ALLWA|nr:DEAD/DEAH box helicase [Allochromatium warmingii]SDY06987.1 Superfamily II DNA and RNA helicase [Allochromatium warmingii]
MNTHFSELLLPDALMRGLANEGYATATPVQAQVIPLAMDGLDLLVSAATGSGKTAAFLLPIMQRFLDAPRRDGSTRALILVPTRELARQIHIHFMRLGSYTRLQSGVITGGESKAHQIATLRKNPEILVATPGRLLEFLETGQADLHDLEFLVLDEADRMLDMGFADDVLAIIRYSRPQRQSLLFSATLDHRGLRPITERLLRNPQRVEIDAVRQQHPDIAHWLFLSDGIEHKREQVLWLLRNETYDKAVIFTNTRAGAEALGNFLQGQQQRVAVLHGELDQRERNRVMGLLHSGRVSTLIATDLAARGLDVPGVQRVFNFDLPRSGDDYLHRTGRTGRAGEAGVAISLVSPQEWNRMESITRYLNLTVEQRDITGLKASFKGPVKRKKPSKPTATSAKRKATAAVTEQPRKKERLRDRKNIGKRRVPASVQAQEAGHAPLTRRGRDVGGKPDEDSTAS